MKVLKANLLERWADAPSIWEMPGDATSPETGEIELSILMPCLNEAETLEKCISKAKRFLQDSGVAGEILIADNGSTDGSQDIARRNGARLVQVPIQGYGAALRSGIAAARGRYVIMGDADDSYDFSNLMPFVDKLRDGYDLAMGNRFKGGIARDAMPFLHRYIGNPVLSLIGRIFFGAPVGDFHCGLRGFKRAAIEDLKLNTTGMEFASEMVVRASLNKLKITEVPTTLSKDGRSRRSHLRTWRDGWRHLTFLLLHCPRWLFLVPGLLSLGIGMVAMLSLLPGPLIFGRVQLDVHTLVVAAATIDVGVNTLMFWFLAQQYAAAQGILPKPAWHQKMLSIVTLERSIAMGVVTGLLGLAGLIRATLHWSSVHFGQLDYVVMLRQVVPSATLIILGSQIIFFGFFTSLLKLGQQTKQ